ncbi:NUDIX domain-containing protein [Desulforamulus ruminis]|uniref:NUDIX hydrolase n=1 Tax=Desulforamulus ruminis (strain ATCC 23193 / DSM 2154 / NCIMB 8452 / DL) TaxID=696281 RepID=F6DPV9_DESRL|nr:NUDIX domain-containing protein [Desulforamulus ruminis]AEG60798.1 NUDIX hydrolase [Desulforamulus ruminis DSM 2154]
MSGCQPGTKFSIRVMIVNSQGQVLLGLKKKGYHASYWIFPGGQIEFGETVAQCGTREVWEESRLQIEIKGLLGIASEIQNNKHVVFLHLLASGDGCPQVTEPEEVLEWRWFDTGRLPDKTTLAARNAIGKYQQGQAIIPV